MVNEKKYFFALFFTFCFHIVHAQLAGFLSKKGDSIFHVASIFKQFTSLAIITLSLEGKLSLKDEIRKYLLEVPDFGLLPAKMKTIYLISIREKGCIQQLRDSLCE